MLEAFHRDGIVVLEGLPTHDEDEWVNATRRAFLTLVPMRLHAQVTEDAYWHTGDASRPNYNDYTNEGRQVTEQVTLTADGATKPEHPGWYGGALKLHQDGCYTPAPPRLKMYAPWGDAVTSTFADGRRAISSLPDSSAGALREAAVTVTYEGRHAATAPVLRTDGTMCFNPGDACTVERANASDVAGGRALDELAALLGDSDLHLKVPAGTGMAFVVDNTRVLHGRIGQVAGRRRVVGGEAPAGAVAERWAEVARVDG